MSFPNLLLLLAGLVFVILAPVAFGYGLSAGSVTAMGISMVTLAIGALLLFVHIRLADREPARGHGHAAH